jgi:cytidylate kinase
VNHKEARPCDRAFFIFLSAIRKLVVMKKITIAIDGFSSCGKSTMAKALAQRLQYSYIDTGAMYRAVTLYAIRHGMISAGLPLLDKIEGCVEQLDISFRYNEVLHQSEVYLNGENVENEIRGMEVSSLVSKVAAIKKVRATMVVLQRKLGKNKAVVMDGRDIGTSVFPNAELKLFMTADPEVRARRRMDEYSSKGQFYPIEEVKESLRQRDHDDMTRAESPLVKADDAIVLDNSELSREQQLEFVLKLIADLHFADKSELRGQK